MLFAQRHSATGAPDLCVDIGEDIRELGIRRPSSNCGGACRGFA